MYFAHVGSFSIAKIEKMYIKEMQCALFFLNLL